MFQGDPHAFLGTEIGRDEGLLVDEDGDDGLAGEVEEQLLARGVLSVHDPRVSEVCLDYSM